MADESKFSNRLINEKSPYLLQHAHNPVDWYAWGEEAFTKAAKEDKPVFLSIGYSTCHWCHVMEEETYSNPGIAKILNEYFVAVKVDREERPDIDLIYMKAVQAMAVQGGWPLNVFLSPDKKPFYGGTYFSPEYLNKLLSAIIDSWKNNRDEIMESSARLINTLNSAGAALETEEAIPESIFDNAFSVLFSAYDPKYGGFSAAPKFPTPHSLSFLLRYYHKAGNKIALEMVENTLDHIMAGGIRDHLGGGFHRYSTDREWFLPHFEKMLYDQALLAAAYLEACQITGKEKYAEASRGIFEYVFRDMMSPEGGFYSAEDADSAFDAVNPDKKKEGAYYVWTKEEIVKCLGEESAEIFNYYYGVEESGNVSNDPRDEFPRMNILSVRRSAGDMARYFEKTAEEIEAVLSASRQKLLLERGKRPRPGRDDKILTDWNGLMISSLALGGKILREKQYLDIAERSAGFILKTLKTKDGRLLHRFRDNAAEIPGFLDDYAFFIKALLDLYDATLSPAYIKEAIGLSEKMIQLFEDSSSGGFYFTADDGEKILANRGKEYYDGALPSGNSMAALDLLRINRVSFRKYFEIAAQKSIKSISGELANFPASYTQMLIALDYSLTPY